MLPCHKSKATSERTSLAAAETSNAPDHCASQVLNYSINLNHHILENEEFFFFYYLSLIVIDLQGKTSFISQDGILQLNNFIFVLAVMQIIYSVLTMALGRAKVYILYIYIYA
jgi:hypothetical protein